MPETVSTRPNKLARVGLVAAVLGSAAVFAAVNADHEQLSKPSTSIEQTIDPISVNPTAGITNASKESRAWLFAKDHAEVSRSLFRDDWLPLADSMGAQLETVAAQPVPESEALKPTPQPKESQAAAAARPQSAPETQPSSSQKSNKSSRLAKWLLKLRACETGPPGGNYKADTGNGYYGAYQFLDSTWDSLHTGYPRADLAPPGVQDQAIIDNTRRSSSGLASQNPGCYHKEHLSKFPPSS